MKTSSQLSIAICTHNRPAMLARLIGRIAPQAERAGVWLTVVDSASDPGAARQVAVLLKDLPLARLIRLDRSGVSLARNCALEATSTPWLAFFDDDELPAIDWLDNALALCGRLPDDCAACGGDTVPLWPVGIPLPPMQRRWRQYLSLIEQAGEFDQSEAPHFMIGHSIVRVEALRAVGGFDPALGRDGATLLSGEEVLLVDMLLRAKWRIWHSDRLWLEHEIEPERLGRAWARNRAYWEGVTRARVLRMSAPHAYRRLCRDIAVRAPALRLLARWPIGDYEFDLRHAFAAGVNAERRRVSTAEMRPPSPAVPKNDFASGQDGGYGLSPPAPGTSALGDDRGSQEVDDGSMFNPTS
jgi:glycosyltransferase involved in cell wall biosynthesis